MAGWCTEEWLTATAAYCSHRALSVHLTSHLLVDVGEREFFDTFPELRIQMIGRTRKRGLFLTMIQVNIHPDMTLVVQTLHRCHLSLGKIT